MGRVLAFDIEADGLAEIVLDGKGQAKPVVSKIHCVVTIDVATGEEFLYRPHQIREAWEQIKSAHAVIAHNGDAIPSNINEVILILIRIES